MLLPPRPLKDRDGSPLNGLRLGVTSPRVKDNREGIESFGQIRVPIAHRPFSDRDRFDCQWLGRGVTAPEVERPGQIRYALAKPRIAFPESLGRLHRRAEMPLCSNVIAMFPRLPAAFVLILPGRVIRTRTEEEKGQPQDQR